MVRDAFRWPPVLRIAHLFHVCVYVPLDITNVREGRIKYFYFHYVSIITYLATHIVHVSC